MNTAFVSIPASSGNDLLATRHRMLFGANPDFETIYPSVTEWWLEVTGGTRQPVRQVGLAERQPAVLGPFRRNPGIWIIDQLSLGSRSDSERPVKPRAFESAWAKLSERFAWVAERVTYPITPLSDESPLCGQWYCEGGWGSMSDWAIVFLNDGRGYTVFSNGGYVSYELFNWRYARDGVIQVRGIVGFSPDDPPDTSPWRSDWNTGVHAGLQQAFDQQGQRYDILHLNFGHTRKSLPSRWVRSSQVDPSSLAEVQRHFS